MNIVRNTNITINNNGFMPMGGPIIGGPMVPMGGMYGPSLFGCGFAGGIVPPNNEVAAGMCTGMAARMLISTPGALKSVGKVIAWPFKMIGKGAVWVWNHALKPAGQWIGGLFTKKSSKTQES